MKIEDVKKIDSADALVDLYAEITNKFDKFVSDEKVNPDTLAMSTTPFDMISAKVPRKAGQVILAVVGDYRVTLPGGHFAVLDAERATQLTTSK
jgi:hypothetical protein